MAVTFRDYSGDLVEAAHSVLLELVRLLGEYRDDLVVVGGWVRWTPFFGQKKDVS